MKKILFKSEMVRAILDGRKTQTRRIHADMSKPRYNVGDVVYVGERYCTCDECLCFPDLRECFKAKWKPGMFMPEEYARIKLKITGKKKERICDISEADAIAEGFNPRPERNSSAVQEFLLYFAKINPKAEPETEVWVYTFERIK